MRQILLVLLLSCISVRAQLDFKGVGIFGAMTQSAHYYKNTAYEDNPADTSMRALYPQSHISKEFFNWGAGAFVELGGPRIRWQTELEYTHKGANEKEVINPRAGTRASNFSPNKYTYLQWNNYAKFWYNIGSANWYWMPGVRLEYLLSSAPTVFLPVSADFPKFWFSGDLGVGYEFPLFKRYSAFVEYHWNPDVISHKHDVTKVRNRTFELRVGLVMRPKKRSIDDCNAPVYKGPAY